MNVSTKRKSSEEVLPSANDLTLKLLRGVRLRKTKITLNLLMKPMA